MKTLAVKTAVALLLFLLAGVHADASDIAAAVRNLAENVLGSGSVTSLAVTDRGARVLIRWESATFKNGQKLDDAREGVAAEAQLATGSILGRLFGVTQVRFSIRRGETLLAFGENHRSRGFTLKFADALGGGTYVRTASTHQRSGGGADPAKEY